jgi:hypothetical protein
MVWDLEAPPPETKVITDLADIQRWCSVVVLEDEIVASLPEFPQDLGDPSVPGMTSSVRRPQCARGDPKVWSQNLNC